MKVAQAQPQPFWSKSPAALYQELRSAPEGLDPKVARERLKTLGPNLIREERGSGTARLFAKQFASPLVMILLFGALVSFWLRDTTDGAIIVLIVCGSAFLSFWQEARASKAVAALRSRLALTSRVFRGGAELTIAAAELVPGDIIILSAGNLVPADGLIIECTDFLVTQAALTGESLPVEKRPGLVSASAPVSGCSNAVFMGSSVRSGTARVLVAHTGVNTQMGSIAKRLQQAEPETDFERGVRHFGGMLLRVMFLIVTFVLAINQLIGRPFVESMLFAVALAVGLSPELLPAIVTVTLSAGARHLAAGGVIVRRLEALENFGCMTVLCTDKTGTITTGEVALCEATDPSGQDCTTIKRLAFLNAALETGIANPLDAALVSAGALFKFDTSGVTKIDEIPYDFQRRRLTIVFEEDGKRLLVTKGAFAEVLSICSQITDAGSSAPLTPAKRVQLERYFTQKGEEGFRVLAVATKAVELKPDYTIADEKDLLFAGFLLFLDPPKEDAAEALRALRSAGIATKIISGDNRYISAHVGKAVGLDSQSVLTGEQLAAMSDDALWHRAPRTDLFVEIEPQQKERIVRALQKAGYAVGYLGDGINDAPALHAADIGISVEDAVDVARESADIVLLKSDLKILCQGVEDGRRTFANTLKYVSIAISSNFGNMVSMAIATPILPFLPLLPKQILLNNFLADLPALAISTDRVDQEQLRRAQRWDLPFVRRFMLVFGLGSSLFDFITFGALLLLFHAGEQLFHTGWFIVSLITQMVVVLVLRTRRLAWQSKPSKLLMSAMVAVVILALALPYSGSLARVFALQPVSLAEGASLMAIVVAYLLATEVLKHWFYRHSLRSTRSRS